MSFKAIRYGWDVNWTEILVPRDSAIQSVDDLDGLTWGIPDYASFSGYRVPMSMWNQAGITPGEIIETGGHSQAVMAVYEGEVDFATSFLALLKEIPPGNPAMIQTSRKICVEDCAPNEVGQLWCGDYRVLDARAMISSDVAPDVVQKVRILEISPRSQVTPCHLVRISQPICAPRSKMRWLHLLKPRNGGIPLAGVTSMVGKVSVQPPMLITISTVRLLPQPHTDIDEDNIADVEDNAPTRYNPDQSDIDSDGIGDVADICPSDPLDECNPSNSALLNSGSRWWHLDYTARIVWRWLSPPTALVNDTSISITDTRNRLSDHYQSWWQPLIVGVEIGPAGTEFDSPVELVFSWDDVDEDGKDDSTNAKEENLIITKDGELITDKCKDEPADGVLPDCDMMLKTPSHSRSTA